jgi:hypothetical protein
VIRRRIGWSISRLRGVGGRGIQKRRGRLLVSGREKAWDKEKLMCKQRVRSSTRSGRDEGVSRRVQVLQK